MACSHIDSVEVGENTQDFLEYMGDNWYFGFYSCYSLVTVCILATAFC